MRKVLEASEPLFFYYFNYLINNDTKIVEQRTVKIEPVPKFPSSKLYKSFIGCHIWSWCPISLSSMHLSYYCVFPNPSLQISIHNAISLLSRILDVSIEKSCSVQDYPKSINLFHFHSEGGGSLILLQYFCISLFLYMGTFVSVDRLGV